MIRYLHGQARLIVYAGTARHCPVCGRSFRKFASAGQPPRMDALCINCGSLERHRLLWLFLGQHPELMHGAGTRLLHVAPEPCVSARLHSMAGPGYLSADLFDPGVMERMDICDIQHPARSFDAVYCNHVLEHVEDDRKALREFHRILRADGWAILMVPTYAGPTLEDPSIVTGQARLAAFGQEDHVRRYGDDFVDRLTAAGFEVATVSARDLATPVEAEHMGLTAAAGEIYFCTKRRREDALP
jgi:SAM-dependent methyltransferase